jgi:hypothetical protein
VIYYIVFGVISVISIISIPYNEKRKTSVFLLLFLTFFLIFGGLRYNVGADWQPYQNIFSTIKSSFVPLKFEHEYFFKLFVYINADLFSSYSIFVFCIFIISFGLKLFILNRYSPNLGLSMLFYFVTIFLYFDTNGIRQGLAISLTFCSLHFLIKRDLKNYLFLTVLAAITHISALVFIPFYWISRVNIPKRIYIAILLLFLLVHPIFVNLTQDNYLLSKILNQEEVSRYNTYVQDNLYGKHIPIISLAMIKRLLVFMLFLIFYQKIRIDANLKRILLNGYFLSLILFIAFSNTQEMAARLGFYYKIFDLIILPSFITLSSEIGMKILTTACIIGFSLIPLIRTLNIPDGNLFPYLNLLFK